MISIKEELNIKLEEQLKTGQTLNRHLPTPYNEVNIFRTMTSLFNLGIFGNNASSTFISETHGKNYVKYASKTINSKVTKEISDLFIVCYNVKKTTNTNFVSAG